MRFWPLLHALLLTVACCSAHAADSTLPAVQVGIYQDPFGFSSPSVLNVGLNGGLASGPGGFKSYRRAFLIFDLTGVVQPITGASLTVTPTEYVSQGGSVAVVNGTLVVTPLSNSSEPFSVFEVTTPANVVGAAHVGGGFPPVTNSAGIAIFNDLGDGAVFGSFTAARGPLAPLTLTLNDAAVSALNSHRGEQIAIGVRHMGQALGGGLFGAPMNIQHLQLSTLAASHILQITTAVPEPSQTALLLGGLTLLAVRLQRRRDERA